MLKEFEKQVVLVTGGSRGIGRAIVDRFVALGARVFFTYHQREDAADAVVQDCGAEKIKVSQADAGGIESAVNHITSTAGRIDVLINNAGITNDQWLMLMPPEAWDQVLDTNLNGAFRWCKAVSRPMLTARHGVIINIASISGLMGVAGQTNYSASKGALLAFSRSLAAELGGKGIRVNAVVPGFIDTDMTARVPRAIREKNLDRILVKRFGKPAEIASVVTFLASNDATYIVGQTIIVDGGLTSAVA
jgi:3-oxoacyl-[acyl-carrier protein] reductase